MKIVSLLQNPDSMQPATDAPAIAGRDRLEVVSEQFEALFLQQILKQMRKAGDVLTADNPMRSRELDIMHDFHDEAIAESLARKKQTGIADMLVQQLSGRDGRSASPVAAVESVSDQPAKVAIPHPYWPDQSGAGLPSAQAVEPAEFNSNAAAVALKEGEQNLAGVHQSVAFAQPIRIKLKD
jgi:soluble lytic murein transglycosylase